MKKILIIMIIILLFVGLGYKLMFTKKSNNTNEIDVTIPLGTGSKGIADILKENDIIRSKLGFRIYVKLNKVSNFQAGKYYLRQNMTLKEITNALQNGIMYDPNEIKITYLEGKNFRWLASKIEEITNNSKDDVYNLIEDETYLNSLIDKYWFITSEIKNNSIYYPLEGYLFPDTYALKNKDVKVEEIFEKMLNRMDEVLKEYRSDIEKGKYNVHEILTMASIIEMESINNSDRKDVSSVLYNRLNGYMAMQSDVTTYYAIKVDVGERDLYQKELDTYNPYNTRGPDMNGKLPVGPIASVSKTSIEAAVKPNNSNYYYFVADKNGKVYFSKTLSEHNEIIRKLKNEGLWLNY